MAGLNPQLVGNVGLYHTCLKLSLMGWNVMPTARNARGVDLIAYNEDATRIIAVQIKTLSKFNPVPLGSSLSKIMGDWWIIVTRVASDSPTTYIMLPDEVRTAAHVGEKDGKTSCWLQPKSYNQEQYREAWERIGHGGLDSGEVSH